MNTTTSKISIKVRALELTTDDSLYLKTYNKVQCKTTRAGLEYAGKMAHSFKGNACIPWSLFDSENQTQLQHEADTSCRNPDNNAVGPWCYIKHLDKQREYCPIPPCDVSDLLNELPNNTTCKCKFA